MIHEDMRAANANSRYEYCDNYKLHAAFKRAS